MALAEFEFPDDGGQLDHFRSSAEYTQHLRSVVPPFSGVRLGESVFPGLPGAVAGLANIHCSGPLPSSLGGESYRDSIVYTRKAVPTWESPKSFKTRPWFLRCRCHVQKVATLENA